MVQLKFGLVISDLVKNLGLMEQNGYDGPFLAYAKAFTVTNFTNHNLSSTILLCNYGVSN